MPNVHFSFRRGAGGVPEILYGKVEIKPTLAFARGSSLVLPAPTTLDLVNGEATANNVYPTPAPVAGQVEWAYRVKAIDTRGQSFEWMVGVPDSTGTLEFTSLPRYFETKPPLFGQGPKGESGEAAKITIGTTTSGTTPSVSNSGTNQNAILNFVLPKGDKGDTGAQSPETVVGGEVVGDDLTLSRLNGTTFSAGNVRGPQGIQGIPGPNTIPTDEAVAGLLAEGVTTSTGEAGDARWVTHEGADYAVATVFGQVGSDTRGSMDLVYANKAILSLNPVDFGADRTGTVDSTVQIQNCFDQIEGVGTVLFPPGEYLISGALSVPQDTTITGYGARIKRTANEYMIFPGGQSQNPTFYNGVSRVSIFGLELHGNAGQGLGKALLPMAHCKDFIFRDVRFVDIGEHALDIAGCDTVEIYNCEFYGQIVSVNVGEAVQLDVTSPTGFPHHGAWDYTVSRNITVRKCRFGPNAESGLPAPRRGVGSHAAVQGVPYENIVVEDSEFYGIRDTAIVTRNWEGSVRRNVIRGAKGIYVSPSHIGDPTSGGIPSTVSSTTRRFEIEKNDILVTGVGIELYGREGGSMQNIGIEGNLIGCTTTAPTGSIHGIYLRGFYVANVRGNIVRDFPGNGVYSVPPQVSIPCEMLTVEANTIVNSGTNGIYINASKTVKLTGNTTSGIGWASDDGAHVRALGSNENLTISGHIADPTGDVTARGLHISSSASRVTRTGNNWNGLSVSDSSTDPIISGERL